MRTTTGVVRQSSAEIAIILVLLSTYCIDRSGENSLEKRQPDFDTSKWKEIYSCQSNFRTSYHKRERISPSDQRFTRCADIGVK